MWVWGKNFWNEHLGPQWRFMSNSMVHFFTKMWKMPDLGFGTSYKDGLCPKLEKNPAKPKFGPQNVSYVTSCPFIRSSRVLGFAIFG